MNCPHCSQNVDVHPNNTHQPCPRCGEMLDGLQVTAIISDGMGGAVKTTLTVTDPETIKMIKAGTLREFSIGYVPVRCKCHKQMGNDFYFLPTGSCLYGACDAPLGSET